MPRGLAVVARSAILVRRSWRVFREEGPRMLALRVATKLAGGGASIENLLVSRDDALAVDLSTPHPAIVSKLVVKDRPLKLAWISSPPGKESGGHHNMFRFIKFAMDAGHRATVYIYDAQHDRISMDEVRRTISESDSYPDGGPEVVRWSREMGVARDTDAIVATGWETAYPAYLDASPARRLYFVQDFEPLFYPTGSQALLAENTYRFGFDAITAGRWLSKRLNSEYGMRAEPFDFAADTKIYRVTNEGPRSEVFFYARPVTSRRAFELGILALERFAELHPEATINLAGWDVSNLYVPFAHINHASMALNELTPLYNRCATGLVLSLTNLSLLPLELLAAGVTPVVNDGLNNRLVTDNPRIFWTKSTPAEIAHSLATAYEAARDGSAAQANAASVDGGGWSRSGEQFVTSLERMMSS